MSLFSQSSSWSWTRWWVLWSSTPAAWQNWCVTHARASTGCAWTQSLFPSEESLPAHCFHSHTPTPAPLPQTQPHLSLLCSATCAQRHKYALTDRQTHNYVLYAHTVHLWSSMYTQTHTHDELLRHIFNTVSISYTSLPKTLSNLEHLTTSTAPHREKHQNCSTGTKKSLLPRVIYRHSYKIFEGHVSIYLAWKCWVNYLMNTLKNAFFCWFFLGYFGF